MSSGAVLWDGFSSFFSIWQLCILQISPFCLAFMVGIYFASLDRDARPAIGPWVILPYAAYALSFTLIYSLLIASGLAAARVLTSNLGNLRLAAGLIILVAGLHLLWVDRLPTLRKAHQPLVLAALALLLGIAFAVIYSPCISPTLSYIMGLATQPPTAREGWGLALSYGGGLSIALGLTAVCLILLLRRSAAAMRNIRTVKNVCGVIVLAPAVLSITGLMRHYKAFILGFLV